MSAEQSGLSNTATELRTGLEDVSALLQVVTDHVTALEIRGSSSTTDRYVARLRHVARLIDTWQQQHD